MTSKYIVVKLKLHFIRIAHHFDKVYVYRNGFIRDLLNLLITIKYK